MLGSERIPAPSIESLIAQTRETYCGPLAVGEDLTSFDIGQAVVMNRASGAVHGPSVCARQSGPPILDSLPLAPERSK
jgi:hypothetical protein